MFLAVNIYFFIQSAVNRYSKAPYLSGRLTKYKQNMMSYKPDSLIVLFAGFMHLHIISNQTKKH